MSSSWRLVIDAALADWQARDQPSEALVDAFYEWGFSLTEHGPPVDAEPVPGDGDRFVYQARAIGFRVDYLAIAQDLLIIFRDIRSL